MPKPRSHTGEKNLIADKLKSLREEHGMSQRRLAMEFQLIGCDIDKNVITRIELNKRYVTDIELCAIGHVFRISMDELFGKRADCLFYGAVENNETTKNSETQESGEEDK